MTLNSENLVENEIANRIYESYEDALKVCSAPGYEAKELVNVVIEKTKILEKEITNKNVFDFSILRIISAILLAQNNKEINVIDFGGAAGHHYLIAKKILGDKFNLNWNVIETTRMTNECSKIFSSKNLNFYDNAQKVKNNSNEIDLVFTSSALQYCSNPVSTLRELLALNAKYLFITRTPFSPLDHDLISVQKSLLSDNGPGPLPNSFQEKIIYYPVTFISRKKIEDLISENYDVEFILEEDHAKLFLQDIPINNYYGYFCKKK